MKKIVGVITGKFAPLHSGHLYAIMQAATQCSHLYVILSHDQDWVDSLGEDLTNKLSYKNKLLWLKTCLKDFDHITVVGFDETNIAHYPHGVEDWCNGVLSTLLLEHNVNSIDKWFSSESEYSWWVEKYLTTNHVVIDESRSNFNISATEVRADPLKHWQYLPTIVRKEFVKKVVVIGTESSAKSSLTKYLAKMFNTSWVDEFGRDYCLNEMCGDENLLSFKDYGIIAQNRNYQEHEAVKTANKVLFVDTNAFITQFYCELYEGKPHPLVDAFIEDEKYDLVLHLSDEVEWVDDGLRINSDRKITSKLFEEMLDKYKVKDENYHYIEGDYNQRLQTAINLVNEKLLN